MRTSCSHKNVGKKHIAGKLASCVCCPSVEDSDMGSHYTTTKDHVPSPLVLRVVNRLEDIAREEAVTLADFKAGNQASMLLQDSFQASSSGQLTSSGDGLFQDSEQTSSPDVGAEYSQEASRKKDGSMFHSPCGEPGQLDKKGKPISNRFSNN